MGVARKWRWYTRQSLNIADFNVCLGVLADIKLPVGKSWDNVNLRVNLVWKIDEKLVQIRPFDNSAKIYDIIVKKYRGAVPENDNYLRNYSDWLLEDKR